jgi:DNA ligase-1
LIAPEFSGIDIGVAEKLAIRVVATVAGTDAGQVAALVREAGDLGQAVEQLLTPSGCGSGGGAVGLEVAEVVGTLREIAVAEGAGSQGRKLELLAVALTYTPRPLGLPIVGPRVHHAHALQTGR